MYLLAICTFSFENSLFNSWTHFFIAVLIVWGLKFLSSLFILDIHPLSDEYLAKIFSHSVGCCLSLVTVSFAVQKFFTLMLCC
jgi:predicted membrane channel-forming protein YqfA (hemolysin III family)